MKKYVIFLVLLIATLCVKAQSIIPQVNENVELMSILSRMAGFPEYHMDMAGQYIKDMDSYFKESTDHPAVQYMKGLRNKYVESSGKCKISKYFYKTRFLGLKTLIFCAVYH